LDPLYWGVKENPGNLDSDSARLACYQRFDLVGDDVTVDQFMADPDNQIYARTDGDAWGCDKDPFNYQGGHPDVDSDDLSESDLAASHSVDG
jgi:hypothetical protein